MTTKFLLKCFPDGREELHRMTGNLDEVCVEGPGYIAWGFADLISEEHTIVELSEEEARGFIHTRYPSAKSGALHDE